MDLFRASMNTAVRMDASEVFMDCRDKPTPVRFSADGALVFSLATPQASFPRRRESSNLMRLLRFSAVLQMPPHGVLDHPPSRMMTSERVGRHESFSRRLLEKLYNAID